MSNDNFLEMGFGERLAEALKNTTLTMESKAVIKQGLDNQLDMLLAVEGDLEKFREVILAHTQKSRGEILALQSMEMESQAVLDALNYGIENTLTIWKNIKFLRTATSEGIKGMLENVDIRVMKRALRDADPEARDMLRKALDETEP